MQGAVSIVLLGVAVALHASDSGMANTIIGAVIGLWLRESVHLGQQVSQQIKSNGNGNAH